MYENLKNELKDIKIISMMCDLEEKIYEKINSICEKYGVEANCYDFDYSRVYKKGYDTKENWDDYYLFSVDISYQPTGKFTEDEEEFYMSIVEIC